MNDEQWTKFYQATKKTAKDLGLCPEDGFILLVSDNTLARLPTRAGMQGSKAFLLYTLTALTKELWR